MRCGYLRCRCQTFLPGGDHEELTRAEWAEHRPSRARRDAEYRTALGLSADEPLPNRLGFGW